MQKTHAELIQELYAAIETLWNVSEVELHAEGSPGTPGPPGAGHEDIPWDRDGEFLRQAIHIVGIITSRLKEKKQQEEVNEHPL